MRRAGWLGLLALVLVPPSLPAQAPPTTRVAAYLVTFGPGAELWERFGHNALLFRDSVSGESVGYDFGRFDFLKPGFVLAFARGRMEYWMGREDGVALINHYIGLGRPVWLQELNLASDVVAALRDSLESTLSRDRGLYRYDYYRDNCSTRIRDALDVAAGGALGRRLKADTTDLTLRDHSRMALVYSLPIYAGVMAALGPATDRRVTAWEAAFLPVQLMRHIQQVEVTGSAGQPEPLVRGAVQLAESELFAVPESVPVWPLRRLAMVGVFGAMVLVLLALGGTRSGVLRWGFLAAAALWQLAVGLSALALFWFWGLSEHVAAHRNANVLHFTIVAFVFLAVVPGMIRGNAPRLRIGLLCARLGVALSLVGVLVALSGLVGQQMTEVTVLTFPLHAGVLAGMSLLVRTRTPSPSGVPTLPR